MEANKVREIVIYNWQEQEEKEFKNIIRLISETAYNGGLILEVKDISERVVLKLKILGYKVIHYQFTIPTQDTFIIDWK